jgi:hypothetical protein
MDGVGLGYEEGGRGNGRNRREIRVENRRRGCVRTGRRKQESTSSLRQQCGLSVESGNAPFLNFLRFFLSYSS